MNIFRFAIVALSTVCIVACVNEDIQFEKGNISRDVAYKLVLNELNEPLKEVDIWATREKMPGNTGNICGSNSTLTSPGSASWFFFVDMMPMGNWGHLCHYLFVDMDGNVYDFQESMPPLLDVEKTMELLNESEARKNYDAYPVVPTKSKTRSGNDTLLDNHYAVIISGGGDPLNNHIRYWNDCAEVYFTLVEHYGYDPSKVFVLMSDGTDPGIDNSMGLIAHNIF